MSVAAQTKPNRCVGSMTFKQCAENNSHNPTFFDTADIKKWKKAVEVADYDVADVSSQRAATR